MRDAPRPPPDPLTPSRSRGEVTARSGRQGLRLWTVGHSTASQGELVALLAGAGVQVVVDVRSMPGSRRHPQFAHAQLELWLPAAGFDYRWEADLGGFRRTSPESLNVALRHPSFRGYADYMATDRFSRALGRLVYGASERPVAVMCAETLWWRCHRRLIADAATLLFGVEVTHIGHDGRLGAHRLTEGVRCDGLGGLVYDAGQEQLDPTPGP